jgi:hypothetical protein
MFSNKWCALMMIGGAAASKPTLPLIPIIVSPTCVSLPIAYACNFSKVTMLLGFVFFHLHNSLV